MAMIVPTASENKVLEYALGKSTPGALTLKLYVNNYTPIDGTVAGDFTEMSTQGYASKTLAMASWTVAQVSSKAEGSYAVQTWTANGSGGATTVYGYYVVDTGGALLWAEKFATARVVTNSGDQINLTPKFTLSKE